MIFTETALEGAFIVDPQLLEDARGFFARTWCQREFALRGLNPRLVQCSISYSARSGTLRGLHYQIKPFEEAKLVRCIAGAIYDVIIDLRPGSSSYMQWLAVELTAGSRRMIYVPEGCAHGFQTLRNDTEVLYQMSEFHEPGCARGIRWDDPAFGVDWPAADRIISEQDRGYPDFASGKESVRR